MCTVGYTHARPKDTEGELVRIQATESEQARIARRADRLRARGTFIAHGCAISATGSARV
jgi:hypothetical protein